MSKISFLLIFCVFFSPINFAVAQTPESYDLLITNARIIDGAGNPWFRGAIAVRDGKIVDRREPASAQVSEPRETDPLALRSAAFPT